MSCTDTVPTSEKEAVDLSGGRAVADLDLRLWAAAKVFRIGLLMYGKPPNLRTLAR